MNFWRQTTNIMAYFKGENFRDGNRLPSSFMAGFLEVSDLLSVPKSNYTV
jgi:NADH dehydrogenase (ubiquinone) 1 alpha subcomplex subunit 6